MSIVWGPACGLRLTRVLILIGIVRQAAAVSASVPKPTLTFSPGSISLDSPGYSERASYTLDWGDSGPVESLKSVDTYELQEHIGVIPSGGSFSASDTGTHRPTQGLEAITGKEHGPAYSYRVRACVDYDGNGRDSDDECGPWSDIKEVDATELSGGPGLRADIAQRHVNLDSGDNYWSWLPSYDLEWDDAPGQYASYLEPSEPQECSDVDCDADTAVWTDLSSVGLLRASVSNKTPGESYSYRIRLCNTNDLSDPERCSGYSYAHVNVLVLNEGASGLTSNDVSNDGAYTISWDEVKDTRDVANAQVYVLTEEISDSDGNVTGTNVYRPQEERKEFADRQYGSSYTYSLKACFGDGLAADTTCREQTGSFTVSVELSAPANAALEARFPDPDDGSYTSGHDGSYTAQWSEVAGKDSYTIQELALAAPADSCPDSSVEAGWADAVSTPSLAGESHGVAGKGSGKAFCYRVRAVLAVAGADDVVSAWSAALKVKVPSLEVPTARVNNGNPRVAHDNSYRISWRRGRRRLAL